MARRSRIKCPKHGLRAPCLICRWPEEKAEGDAALEARAAEVIAERKQFVEKWFVVNAVMPVDMRVLWEEVTFRFRELGIAHENPEVEAGMVIELLAAEWLAGVRNFGYGIES